MIEEQIISHLDKADRYVLKDMPWEALEHYILAKSLIDGVKYPELMVNFVNKIDYCKRIIEMDAQAVMLAKQLVKAKRRTKIYGLVCLGFITIYILILLFM